MSAPEPQPKPDDDDTLHWASAVPHGKARDLTNAALGDFQVDRLIGRGGMGEVYLARQISLNREVALKVLRPDLLTNPTYLSRFEAEAWAAAKLNDPNIVHIYTLGCVGDIRFIAMEYVQGTNLRAYLLKKGPPDLPLALSIMRQAGSAVKAAGEVGLIHRDIKPENLLMTRKGLVKVADFGLCHDLDSTKPHLTQLGQTMGTPLYMSPEQAQGHKLDHRSDLYSLGVTFYHMLAGQAPFRGETAVAIALKHVKAVPVDLSVHRPDLPVELCRLVMKLIEKEPDRRYQSASEMLRDLAKIRETHQAGAAANGAITTQPIPIPDVSAVTQSNSSSSRLGSTVADAPRPGRRGLLVGLQVLCLISGVLLGWFLRPTDLLAEGVKTPPRAPALWIDPAWPTIPKALSPELQYRYAQIQSNSDTREAAWLAVPGYFPNSREWASKAYIQLARHLFRDKDLFRLKAFASELTKMGRSQEEMLAKIIGVGVGVLENDPQAVINGFGSQDAFLSVLSDAALAELSLEITVEAGRARRSSVLSPTQLSKLRTIENGLVQKTIQIMFRDVLARPNLL